MGGQVSGGAHQGHSMTSASPLCELGGAERRKDVIRVSEFITLTATLRAERQGWISKSSQNVAATTVQVVVWPGGQKWEVGQRRFL